MDFTSAILADPRGALCSYTLGEGALATGFLMMPFSEMERCSNGHAPLHCRDILTLSSSQVPPVIRHNSAIEKMRKSERRINTAIQEHGTFFFPSVIVFFFFYYSLASKPGMKTVLPVDNTVLMLVFPTLVVHRWTYGSVLELSAVRWWGRRWRRGGSVFTQLSSGLCRVWLLKNHTHCHLL